LQKLYDDHRRKRESKFEDYEELFALDYGKVIAVHYHFLSQILQLVLDRAIEEIDPPTTNVAIHYIQGPQNPPLKQMGTHQRQRQQRSDQQTGTPPC
jgi:hypothetical protein